MSPPTHVHVCRVVKLTVMCGCCGGALCLCYVHPHVTATHSECDCPQRPPYFLLPCVSLTPSLPALAPNAYTRFPHSNENSSAIFWSKDTTKIPSPPKNDLHRIHVRRSPLRYHSIFPRRTECAVSGTAPRPWLRGSRKLPGPPWSNVEDVWSCSHHRRVLHPRV